MLRRVDRKRDEVTEPDAQGDRVKGLLLDLDGTLADTLPALRRVYSAFLASHGIESGAPHFERLNGLPLPQILALLRCEAGLEGNLRELERDYRARMTRACEGAEPKPGAREILQRADEAGYRMAVVTSGDADVARAWLRRTQLTGFVREVVGAGDVSEGKPSPEPYCLALERLSARAGDSIAVEDSMLGARSAVSAGVVTYVVAAGRARREPGWPRGAHFVDHLAEVMTRL